MKLNHVRASDLPKSQCHNVGYADERNVSIPAIWPRVGAVRSGAYNLHLRVHSLLIYSHRLFCRFMVAVAATGPDVLPHAERAVLQLNYVVPWRNTLW